MIIRDGTAIKPFDITELGARLRLANELLAARRETEILRLGSRGAATAVSTLPAATEVVGVPKLVDVAALKNYLKQLSRSGATSSQVTALGIQQVEDLHARVRTH